MSTKLFINLPVKDLEKSKSFFTNIGFTINPQFSDETAACVVISEDIFAMILTHDKFKTFTSKEISDAHKSTEVMNALTMESRDHVDEMMSLALKAGAIELPRSQDFDFMYGKAFSDLDGHIWEIFWMDPSAVG